MPACGQDQGPLAWTFKTGREVASSPAIGKDGTVYVGSHDNALYAVRPDGKLKWKIETGNWVHTSPAVAEDGTIYFASYDNSVYAATPDGKLKWSVPLDRRVESSPAIGADGTVYIGDDDKNLYAISPKGEVKWKYKTDGIVVGCPAVGADGTIYVGSGDNNLYAINADGSLKWRFATRGEVHSSPAIGADGTIYVGSSDMNLYAVDRTGKEKWHFATGDKIYSSPALGSDGTVYFGSLDGNLYALTGDGALRWKFSLRDWVSSSPAVGADGLVYVGGYSNSVYAFNSQGQIVWKYETGKYVFSSPTIAADGTLYVGSDDGNLYALRTASRGLSASPWPKFRGDATQRREAGRPVGPHTTPLHPHPDVLECPRARPAPATPCPRASPWTTLSASRPASSGARRPRPTRSKARGTRMAAALGIWDTFVRRPGKVWHGQTGDVAADHYHRWADDVDLMAGLGLQAYRFSVSWPRVLPQGAGPVNQKGLDFYDRLVDALLARGIQPFVALHHFDLPQALQDRGGWPSRDTAYRFAEYAAVVARRLGDRARYWVPHNEPGAVAFSGYALGTSAPGLAQSGGRPPGHAPPAALPRSGRPGHPRRRPGPVQIGTAINTSPVYPATAATAAPQSRMDALVNRLTLDPLLLGRYPAGLLGAAAVPAGPRQGGRHGHHRRAAGLPGRQLLHADPGAPRLASSHSVGMEGAHPRRQPALGHVGDLPPGHSRPAGADMDRITATRASTSPRTACRNRTRWPLTAASTTRRASGT